MKRFSDQLLVRRLKKGSLLFLEGEASTYLHLLIEGEALVYKSAKGGREVVIHRFSGPAIIGELANLTGTPFPASCRLERDGVVGLLRFKGILEELEKAPLAYNFLQSLAKKMLFLDNLIHSSLLLDSEARIAKFIYENPDLFESLKQHQVASILNIKPETLSRKLLRFKELGIIENRHGRLVVVDREKIPDHFQW